MSKVVLRNLSFLDRLCKCHKKPKGIKDVVKKCNDDEMRAFVDVLFNIMKKNVPIPKKLEDVIRLHRKKIVHLIDPKYSLKSKRKYFVQSGGTRGKNTGKQIGKATGKLFGKAMKDFFSDLFGSSTKATAKAGAKAAGPRAGGLVRSRSAGDVRTVGAASGGVGRGHSIADLRPVRAVSQTSLASSGSSRSLLRTGGASGSGARRQSLSGSTRSVDPANPSTTKGSFVNVSLAGDAPSFHGVRQSTKILKEPGIAAKKFENKSRRRANEYEMTTMGIAPKYVPPRDFRTKFPRETIPKDFRKYNPKYKSPPTTKKPAASPPTDYRQIKPIPALEKYMPKAPIPAFKKSQHKKLPDLPVGENPLAVKTTTANRGRSSIENEAWLRESRLRLDTIRGGPLAESSAIGGTLRAERGIIDRLTSTITPRTRRNPDSVNPVFKDKQYVKEKKAAARKSAAAEAAAASTPAKGKKGGKESTSKKTKKESLSEHHYESVAGEGGSTYQPIGRRLGETPSGSYTALKKVPGVEMKPLKKKSLLDKAIDKLPAAMKKPYKKKSLKDKYNVPPVPKKSFDPDVSAAGKKKYAKYQNQGFIKDTTINEGKSMLGAKPKQGSNLELTRMDMEVPFRGRLRRNQSQESLVARTGLSQPLETSKRQKRNYMRKQAWRGERGKKIRENVKKVGAGAALVGILGGTIGGAAGTAKYLARNKWEKEEWFPHQKENIKAENDVKILSEIPTPTPTPKIDNTTPHKSKRPIEPSIVHKQHPKPDILPEKPEKKIVPSQKWSAAPQTPVKIFPQQQQQPYVGRHSNNSRYDDVDAHRTKVGYDQSPFV